jgi:hypothetical protein
MKKVKAIFEAEMYSLYYLNNKPIYHKSLLSYEDVERYCNRHKLILTKVTGLD